MVKKNTVRVKGIFGEFLVINKGSFGEVLRGMFG